MSLRAYGKDGIRYVSDNGNVTMSITPDYIDPSCASVFVQDTTFDRAWKNVNVTIPILELKQLIEQLEA